jgi:hypothetical protein
MSFQIPKMSLWLRCYILIGGIAMLFLSPMLKWRALGGSFREAFWTVYREEALHGPPVADIFFAVISIPLLIWFTFYSGNKRVTRGDRIFVSLMLCGGVLGMFILMVRKVFHL